MKWKNGKFTDGVQTIYSGREMAESYHIGTVAIDSKKDLKIAEKLLTRRFASRAKEGRQEKLLVPKGLEYKDFQKAGIQYMRDVPRCLLADDQGLGKTIQICGLINNVPEIKNILIICPSSLKQNWKLELFKWCGVLDKDKLIQILEGRKATITGRLHHCANVVIVNYDLLHYLKDKLKLIKWDLVAIDECHYLKNPEAKRTVAALEICAPVKRVVAMSGTPMSNRPIDMWPLLSGLFMKYLPKEFRKIQSFGKFFCAGFLETIRKYDVKKQRTVTTRAWNYRGASNLGILNSILRERFMLRRLKKDVLKQLPDKTRQIIDLSAPRHLRKAIKLVNEYDLKCIETGKRMPPLEGQARARKELAIEKVKPSLEFINNILSTGEPVVIFCHHKEVAETLKENLIVQGVSMITGSTPQKHRQKAVDDFQSGKNKVFIGNIQAAGTGITLTKSRICIFVENSWVPGEMLQAEDRTHRIGQLNAVNVYYLVWGGTMDAQILKTAFKKASNIEKVMK